MNFREVGNSKTIGGVPPLVETAAVAPPERSRTETNALFLLGAAIERTCEARWLRSLADRAVQANRYAHNKSLNCSRYPGTGSHGRLVVTSMKELNR
jgi:hypothetical protein